MSIFRKGSFHHLLGRAVVPKMDDLYSLGLEESAHNVDGSIMAIEETCRCDKA
jgi:hypothetical protein